MLRDLVVPAGWHTFSEKVMGGAVESHDSMRPNVRGSRGGRVGGAKQMMMANIHTYKDKLDRKTADKQKIRVRTTTQLKPSKINIAPMLNLVSCLLRGHEIEMEPQKLLI